MKRLNSIQADIDAIVTAYSKGGVDEPALERLQEWLEVDGWDDLLEDPGEQNAVNLVPLSTYFDDMEAAHNLGLTMEPEKSDRLQWGRHLIKQTIEEFHEYNFPTIHTFPLESSAGLKAVLGCAIEIHGQLGPVVIWHGVHANKESFWRSLSAEGNLWVYPFMGEVPDEVILRHWRPEKWKKRK